MRNMSNYNHLDLVDVIVNSASKCEFETFVCTERGWDEVATDGSK